MHVLLVNKDGSDINKSNIALLSAFLDLIKPFHGKTGLVWCPLRFFEPISISLGGSKNRNSTVRFESEIITN